MSPRVYQLCREAVTYMAVQEAPLSKRIAKAYFLFLVHLDPGDLPDELRHHLLALNNTFEDEQNGKVGVTKIPDSETQKIAFHVVDLFAGLTTLPE